jgi:hypothetical protein
VARRRGIGVDEVGVIFLIPGMELKDEFIAALHPIVRVAMRMVRKRIEPEQLPVPSAAGANVAYGD